MKKIGLIINPIAGMGGKVGLKGTDGEETLRKAKSLGAAPSSLDRAETALRSFSENYKGEEFRFLCFEGDMGESCCRRLSLPYEIIGKSAERDSSSDDTKRAAKELLQRKADLILFAGGDGTARDICEIAGEDPVVLGIPAGVKIHSAVFAIHPKQAGLILSKYLRSENFPTLSREVIDIDENDLRRDILRTSLYGYMRVPDDRSGMQHMKTGSGFREEDCLEGIALRLASLMEKETLYLVGPGSTTAHLLRHLRLAPTLIGIDAVLNGEMVGKDLSEASILKLMQGRKTVIIVSVIGSQGYLFGRGSQPFSAQVLSKVGKENILALASPDKIAHLQGRPLLVDTGDERVDDSLRGYYRLITGYDRTYVYECR